MARPSKSVRVKTGAIAGDDAAIRQDVEDKLRGENVPPEPPVDLTDGQREIFQFIVNGLVASDILGQLDVFVLESTAIAIDPVSYTHLDVYKRQGQYRRSRFGLKDWALAGCWILATM